jgi:hypothetical protein
VRDVVVSLRLGPEEPRVLGLVVEVPGRRRIFVPMTRVTSIDAGQVITTGLVNMRRFQQRPTETWCSARCWTAPVTLLDDDGRRPSSRTSAWSSSAPATGRDPAVRPASRQGAPAPR